MSNSYGKITLTSGQRETADVGASGLSGVLLGNESALTVKVTLQGAATSRTLYAGTVDFFDIPQGKSFNGIIQFDPAADLNNASSWPSSFVQIDTFGLGERPSGVYPMALSRNTNVGNTVNTAMGGSTSLQNDGNTQTVIIEATPSGAPSSTISIDNEGNFTIKGNNDGTLTTLLQLVAGASPAVKLAAAAVLVEALGGLQVDGDLTVKGSSSLDNADITSDGVGNMTSTGNLTGHSCVHNHADTGSGFYGQDSGGTSRLLLQLFSTDQDGHLYTTPAHKNLKVSKNDGSGDIATFNDTSGFTLNLGKINFGSGIGTLVSLTSGAGTGNGTSNTLITNPTAIVFDPCTVSGSSQTIGGTTTSTTTITTGSGLAWRYIAYLQ